MKTAELTGPALDYWVAKAEGLPLEREDLGEGSKPRYSRYWLTRIPGKGLLIVGMAPKPPEPEMRYAPSVNGSQGHPIIERDKISTIRARNGSGEWMAMVDAYWEKGDGPGSDHEATGPTALIAAMRAYVASKYGEEVPDEAKP